MNSPAVLVLSVLLFSCFAYAADCSLLDQIPLPSSLGTLEYNEDASTCKTSSGGQISEAMVAAYVSPDNTDLNFCELFVFKFKDATALSSGKENAVDDLKQELSAVFSDKGVTYSVTTAESEQVCGKTARAYIFTVNGIPEASARMLIWENGKYLFASFGTGNYSKELADVGCTNARVEGEGLGALCPYISIILLLGIVIIR